MRLAFFGSGEFGVPTLEGLVARGHVVTTIVTQPDRPAGRGGKCRSTPIKDLARDLGLSILTPEKPNDPRFVAEIRAIAPDLAVVVAYGHLIGREMLGVPPHGFVNLHASLLPAYRGAAPVPWAILGGERTSGVSVFRLNERFDEGAVLARAELPIDSDDTSGSYLAKLAPLGAKLMIDTVMEIAAGTAKAVPQNDASASRAPKLKKSDGEIDWSLPCAEIERMVRAFQPWPHAFAVIDTEKGPRRVNVLSLHANACPIDDYAPGTVLSADAQSGLVIQTGDVCVRLAQIQPEGKRPMTDIEFLRGTKVKT